jgi:hypothetical protein
MLSREKVQGLGWANDQSQTCNKQKLRSALPRQKDTLPMAKSAPSKNKMTPRQLAKKDRDKKQVA